MKIPLMRGIMTPLFIFRSLEKVQQDPCSCKYFIWSNKYCSVKISRLCAQPLHNSPSTCSQRAWQCCDFWPRPDPGDPPVRAGSQPGRVACFSLLLILLDQELSPGAWWRRALSCELLTAGPGPRQCC